MSTHASIPASTPASTPASPARLALSLSDPDSSGIIDITRLQAEPLPPSLVTFSPAHSPPPPTASPPRRHRWPFAVLGTALATTLGLFGLVASVPTTPTIVVERPVALERQLSMQEVEAAPVMTAIDHRDERPPHAKARRARGHRAAATTTSDVTDQTETKTAATTEPTTKPETKTRAKRRRSSARRSASPAASTRDAIPVECVLDPSRCDSTAPRSTPSKTSPDKLPAKLSTGQLKAALASTKADAQRCGPQHGIPAGSRVRVKLSIEGKTGSVLSATAMGEHTQTPAGRCAAEALARTQFARFGATRMGTVYSVRM